MTWLVMQHMWFEGPAGIGDAASERGIELRVIRTDQGETTVPSVDAMEAYEGIIALGGAMGALDDNEHPQLAAERALIAAALERQLPVLGVCLGAQLLAIAAGGELLDGDGSEDGIGEVELTAEGRADPVLGPVGERMPVLHWHQDTYSLPAGAVNLARSDRYEQQAFRLGRNAYGVQFHLEMSGAQVAALRDDFPRDAPLDPHDADTVARVGHGVFGRFFDVATATE